MGSVVGPGVSLGVPFPEAATIEPGEPGTPEGAVTLGNLPWAAEPGSELDELAGSRPPSNRGAPTYDNRISTGFSDAVSPADPHPPALPLPPSADLYFWFEVGQPVSGSIEALPIEVADVVPVGAEITVALFGNAGGIIVPTGEGRLRMERSGGRVLAQASALPWSDSVLDRRLFFRIRTPTVSGEHALRCNIYHQGLLVQSLRVTAVVGEAATPEAHHRTELDYVLSGSLRADRLAPMGRHRLSILSNEENGTHGFRFYGGGEVQGSASFSIDGGAVQDFIEQARRTYRRASWGSIAEYDPANPPLYRYGAVDNLAQFTLDLIDLAKTGFRLWAPVAGRLAVGDDGKPLPRPVLQAHMRPPGGRIQLALKRGARHALPVALYYDHPLEPEALAQDLRLCPTFLEQRQHDLLDTPCFEPDGGCPHYGEKQTVCPSGFWGFRHCIGMPMSLGEQGEAPTFLAKGQPRVAALAWAGQDFPRRAPHFEALKAIYGVGYEEALTRAEGIGLLKGDAAHVLYFYCHGDADENGNRRLRIGTAVDLPIGVATFAAEGICWQRSHPLVFINGCHTTDVQPAKAIDFVDELVGNDQAAGVIGTEITIFESLAVFFADRFLAHFNADSNVGEAMRRARLDLLGQQLNPLGLLYVAYALPTLQWRER